MNAGYLTYYKEVTSMITINNKKYNSVEELISTYVPHTIKSPIIRVRVDDKEPVTFIVPDEIGYNIICVHTIAFHTTQYT